MAEPRSEACERILMLRDARVNTAGVERGRVGSPGGSVEPGARGRAFGLGQTSPHQKKKVHSEGFEPPTLGSEDRCSIH
jgi:hypothetical protein